MRGWGGGEWKDGGNEAMMLVVFVVDGGKIILERQ